MSVPFWTDEMRRKAAKMWAEGVSSRGLAAAFDTKLGTVCSMLSRYREIFPARHQLNRRRPKIDEAQPEPKGPADRVVRTTISGAKVTLARVPTIDGDSV